ncbi:MAG: lipoyl synthase [Planctomycetota bacterium]|nr:lipoyl synthase [Planctomycetota bacterium]
MSSDVKPISHSRFPSWLRRRIGPAGRSGEVRQLLSDLHLETVCTGANCPNISECFGRGTATFMIMGAACTRSCRFCAVPFGGGYPLRDDEPEAVAEASVRLGLKHVVITSVTRDDLGDGGAEHFAKTIRAVRRRLPKATVEVLTPDFQGDRAAIDAVLAAGPDVFNHNVETVPRLYPKVRPQARYKRSLDVLAYAKRVMRGRKHRDHGTGLTKSGMMVGLGEMSDEVRGAMRDLRDAGCDILTIGQYLAPSPEHTPIDRFVEPAEFDAMRAEALEMGFLTVAAGPFVRSSYRAEDALKADRDAGDKTN